jgi:zinc/manganese transport system substrate-binding protein
MKRALASIVLVICLMSIGRLGAQESGLNVVATTTILADVAQHIGGDLIRVTALVPPDADTHAFEPTPQDALAVSQADVVLAVGAGYEAFLAGLEENAAREDVVIVSNGVTIYPFMGGDVEQTDEPLDILGLDDICGERHDETEVAESEHEHAGCDPHVWTDPQNAKIWADNIAAALAAADPANADTYTANAEAYKRQLDEADAEIRDLLSAVPEARRMLVTNHEFMNYFARAYGFEVVGVVVPGGTTGAEADPQALAELIQTVQNGGVPAIFAEASASRQLIDSLAQDTGVKVVTTLSESLTAPGGDADTYLAYLKYNAQTVADALMG